MSSIKIIAHRLSGLAIPLLDLHPINILMNAHRRAQTMILIPTVAFNRDHGQQLQHPSVK